MAQIETHEHAQDITSVKPTTMTLNEFLENDVEGYEYIKGELVPMPDASIKHSEIGINLIHYLHIHVRQNNLGRVYSLEISFKIGERVLKPDIAYVSAERLSDDKDKGYPIPPDLAVEVVSPSDIQSRILDKVRAYLDAGTRCVWIVEPTFETVTVYKSETDIKTFTREDTLTGEDVVPGFACPVELLFE